MNKKIYSIGLGICSFFIILSACTQEEQATEAQKESEKKRTELVEMIKEVKKKEKTVSIEAQLKDIKNEKQEITLILKNDNQENINSVRIWLSYNPDQLQALKLETNDDLFELQAPGENTIDAKRGFIKIGNSTAGEGVNKKEIKIATIVVKKLTDEFTAIETFNYQKDESGHTQIISIKDNETINILKKPGSPFIKIE